MQEIQDSLALNETVNQVLTKEVSIYDMITQGGTFGVIIMIVLFLLFVAAIYLFIERFLTIKRSSQIDENFIHHIKDFVYDNKIESAVELCRRTNSPEARMIQKGLQRIGRPLKEISDAIENTGRLEVYKLEKNINYLATIAGAAPMIGFLGTVIGMIMAFMEIANTEGQVDPKLLSSGIYVAMLTTAAGLVVGILAYLFYNFLVMKVDKSVHSMESSVTDFLDLLNKPVVK
ncbi:MotA/TolQ/ExbB proton channel family protein [Weeksellaceae bacterium KMM 9713]|uniref:MotA/TolQ/ExbB proton channel family protein n=1 Tax=Profundicola chukchiensis TaxID=2961959 RepID=A0A9X4RWT5_9FLAO|nr:MotA/TolQ/ExbB proton channel family protein [Profundicola chukchiensis]MDG4944834.1 MotA/TolQ/ExbB proton channel family protein [Profundicola chukchiensis]